MALSKSKVDKLGDRLRKHPEPSEGDRTLLEEFIAEHYEAERLIVDRLRQGVRPRTWHALADRYAKMLEDEELDKPPPLDRVRDREPDAPFLLQPASRIKTIDTTIEKLRRERTRLSTMQDIAGVRVVVKGSRVQQDAVVLGILDLLSNAEVKDRRVNPSSGYRAVHLLSTVAGKRTEIQIRTRLQDLWAQAFERLADVLGRQIRYGEPPTEPDARLAEEEEFTNRQVLEKFLGMAKSIARWEEWTAWLETTDTLASAYLNPSDDPQIQTNLQKIREHLRASQERCRRIEDQLETMANQLSGLGKG